jgi:hypothetical protein
MKKLFQLSFIFLIIIGFIACESDAMKQTESGLQYKFWKNGDGQKVEVGSYVKAKLSLMVEDSVVWTTYDSPDSVFAFVAGKSSVIKGFEEMALLMREGDDVYVSIPDSLAYGSTGAGNVIPPNATIVYDKFELVSVSEPKKMLNDTLQITLMTEGVEPTIAVFESIAQSDQRDQYHMDLALIQPFFGQLLQSRQLEACQALAMSFQKTNWEGDVTMLNYYEIVSMQGMGDLAGAIAKTKEVAQEYPDAPWINPVLQQLEMQQAQQANEE